MKWLKRLILLVVFLGVFAGVLGAAGWWLSRRAPAWYALRHRSPQETAADAARAEREVRRTLGWAQDQQAYADSTRYGGPPSTRPAKTLHIALTEDELNGFFQKWDREFHWSEQCQQYIADPQIVLHNDRLILAATAKEMGTVVSIVFTPQLEHGKLNMPVEQVLAGRLPLPQAMWNRYRAPLEDRIGEDLPVWQEGAQIQPNGSANSDAVAAAMGELLIDILNNHPASPVLFLPYDLSNSRHSLPVKLTSVQIADKTLTLTVEPLGPDERQALLTTIRTPRDRIAEADAGASKATGVVATQ
ncbi:MAG TPA: hypothetical protein VGI81_12805 [Tepidisphaeraceae bacterium]|jgi:hypothetical protein